MWTLNIFHTSFWCFFSWHWTSKYYLGFDITCSKFTTKALDLRSWRGSDFFLSGFPFMERSRNFWNLTQSAFTCPKSIIETLQKKLQNMFKFNNKITKTTSRHWRRSGIFIVNSEHISHSFVFLLLTLSKYIIAGQASSHLCSNLPSKPLETLKMELLAKTVNGLWCSSGFCHSQKLSNFRKILKFSGIFTIYKNKTVPSRKIHAQIQKQKH